MAPDAAHQISLERERKVVLPIIGALLTAIAPHVPGLPLWINLWCFSMWGYMLVRLTTGWPLPPAMMRYLLTFTGIAGLLLTFRAGIGGDAFIGLMALMAALKPFEMPTHRHQMITLLLTYFMIITSLFRSDSMFTLVYMFFSVYVTTTAMVRINSPDKNFAQSRKLAGIILAQALPLVILLFLVFPRLPESIIDNQIAARGKSGFSESIQPGRIAAMARDNTPAFRVTFDSVLPTSDQLYWRGIVFDIFDGSTWMPGRTRDTESPPHSADTDEGTIEQTILMEGHNSRWLVALDRPVKGPSWAVLQNSQTLKSWSRISKQKRYTVISQLPGRQLPGPPPKYLTRAVLAGAGNRNPRTRELAQKLTRQDSTPQETADRILNYFQKNGFVYSLNAPLPDRHPLDTFMFDTRRGYCEHYASAFAFMLNAAGVPARVVGGYLGGELNPFGNYLIVRQSYAHAWVEFFDPENGWTRMDPTSVISPERMAFNPDGSSSGGGGQVGTLSLAARLRFALDALNTQWEAWFTGYSHLEQKAWLAALGIIRGNRAAFAVLTGLTICAIGLFTLLLVRRFKRPGSPKDEVALTMAQFYKKMEHIGINQQSGQGPFDFTQICNIQRPDLAEDINAIMDLYLTLRYKNKAAGTLAVELKKQVKKFDPEKP